MDLGIKVLKLPDFKVQSILFDHKDSIQAAAYDMIRFWSQLQPNKHEAYIALHTGLKEANMNQLAGELQLWVEGSVENTSAASTDGKPLTAILLRLIVED